MSSKPSASAAVIDGGGSSKSASFLQQPLSLQLELEELWTTLSECLDALADTHDPHAVLVLQPTVESFFLVHADHSEDGEKSAKKSSSSHHRRVGRLPSFYTISDTESIPDSPAPHADFSSMPGTPGPSEAGDDPYANLPADTARFLQFAGECVACTVTSIHAYMYVGIVNLHDVISMLMLQHFRYVNCM